RPAVRLLLIPPPPVNSGTTRSATPSHSRVSAPSTIRISQNSVEATRNASRLRPLVSSSVNTGTNAADSGACENRLLNRLGTWEASVNADAAALVAKNAAWATSRPRPATREIAVANAKMAVLTAMRRWGGSGGRGGTDGGGGSGGTPSAPVV